jgi:hypothetical protein
MRPAVLDPSPVRARLSWSCITLQSFCPQLTSAGIGSARPSRPLTRQAGLQGFHRLRLPARSKSPAPALLSWACALLQSASSLEPPRRHRTLSGPVGRHGSSHEVCSPSAYPRSWQQHVGRACLTRPLAPSGFLDLSTLFDPPRACRPCFMPDPLMGLRPSELSSRRVAVRRLRRRSPLDVGPARRHPTSRSRSHPCRPKPPRIRTAAVFPPEPKPRRAEPLPPTSTAPKHRRAERSRHPPVPKPRRMRRAARCVRIRRPTRIGHRSAPRRPEGPRRPNRSPACPRPESPSRFERSHSHPVAAEAPPGIRRPQPSARGAETPSAPDEPSEPSGARRPLPLERPRLPRRGPKAAPLPACSPPRLIDGRNHDETRRPSRTERDPKTSPVRSGCPSLCDPKTPSGPSEVRNPSGPSGIRRSLRAPPKFGGPVGFRRRPKTSPELGRSSVPTGIRRSRRSRTPAGPPPKPEGSDGLSAVALVSGTEVPPTRAPPLGPSETEASSEPNERLRWPRELPHLQGFDPRGDPPLACRLFRPARGA